MKIIGSPEFVGKLIRWSNFFLTCAVVRQFLVRMERWLEFNMRELSYKDYLLSEHNLKKRKRGGDQIDSHDTQ